MGKPLGRGKVTASTGYGAEAVIADAQITLHLCEALADVKGAPG